MKDSREIGIQEFQKKKRRKRKKFPFQQAQNGAPRTCSRPCFLILLGASLKKNVNTKPQEGQKKNPNTPLHIGASRKGYSA